MSVGETFRKLLADPKLLILPGAYDALSAKIIENVGFEALSCGGYAATGSLLGEPDTSQLTMQEYADYYARVAAAVEIPVYVDADTGFGGVNNIRRTVQAFERSGVAGMFFEDQLFPKRCGYMSGKELIPVEEMLAKVKAALDARRDPQFFIAARTDALSVLGIDAAIERAQLYVEAGADMGRVVGADSVEDLSRVCREVPGPQFANLSQASNRKPISFAEIQGAGAAAVGISSASLFAATAAVKRVMGTILRDGSLENVSGDLMALPEFYELVGLNRQEQRENQYQAAALEITRRKAAASTNI